MTPKQKIEVRMSEARTRMREISAIEGEDFTDEIRNEFDALKTEMGDLESRHQAAIMSAGELESRMIGEFDNNGDGESAEVRQLRERSGIRDYLKAATAGGEIRGSARELNEALELPTVGPNGGPLIPTVLLMTPELSVPERRIEQRAQTTTSQNDGSLMQRPILQRLFGADVMDTLGVRIDTVPYGRSEWPLFSTGVAPVQKTEGTAADAAVAATFLYATLKPKKLTGEYQYSHELAATLPTIEMAQRRDLADAVRARMNELIVSGPAVDASTDSTLANVPGNGGFTVALTAVNDTSEADAARYGRLHADGVDGIHASMETEVTGVIGDETYQHSAGVYIAGSGKSGSQLLAERSGGCRVSPFIPDKANSIQNAILHAAGPNGGGVMRGDSVAAMWPTLEVIRDIHTKASQGVVLTWVTMWDAHLALRAGAYALRGIHLG